MPELKKINDQILIIQSPVFELLASMFRITSHEKMKPIHVKEQNSQEFYELEMKVKALRERLSQQLLDELQVFFSYETYLGLSMVRYAWEKNAYQDILAFIEQIEQESPYELFKSFIQTGYTENDMDFIHDTQQVVDYIQRSNLPDVEKWKLTYLYMNIDQTKERFIHLLSTCYHQYFKEEMDPLTAQHERSIENLLSEFKTGGEETIRQILPSLDKDIMNRPNFKIILAPSVYYHVASLNSESEDSLIYLYGIHQPALFKKRRFNETDAIEALKIISDEKRIKMIKLLSLAPCYGYEIAQKLALSSSTVSHHLSLLASINLVRSFRRESRVYYEVDKQAVSELMNRLTILLT